MEDKFQQPACALVRRGDLNVLYVVTDGHEVFYRNVVSRYPGLVIVPDVELDFIALRGNANKGSFYVVNVRYEKSDDEFVTQGLVQAVDESEAVAIVERAKEFGNLDRDTYVRDVMECNGGSFPNVDMVCLCECFGSKVDVDMYVCAFDSEPGGRRLFGAGASPLAGDFVYLFNEGAVPVQLWPSDRYKFGCIVEREHFGGNEHDE